jgi:hypothetical protein
MAGIKNPHRSEEANRLFKAPEWKLINGQAVKFTDVKVHEFTTGDVEDPDIMVADPIWRWQQSDAAKFIMEHAVEKPYWIQQLDHNSCGYKYYIMARLSEQNETFWRLKWGGNQ